MRYLYTVLLNASDAGWMASFPDVPEALTEADTREEALYWAQDALEVAFSGHMEQNREIPAPSVQEDEGTSVSVSPLKAAKLALYQAMRERRMTQLDLSEKLQCDPRQIRRLLDLDHRSRMDLLELALRVFGKRIVVDVSEAA